MFFELEHSEKQSEFYYGFGNGLDYPIHAHRSFEFFSQLQGKSLVVIDEKKYELNEGEAVLIFPFQTHSYKVITQGKNAIIIFSSDMVSEYAKSKANLLPESNLFLYNTPETIPNNLYLQKALAYSICGFFDTDRIYKKREADVFHESTMRLLIYAEEHYKSSCLLGDAVVEIGYDYAYVSKKFKSNMGISFRRYVNMLRITLAKQLLIKGTKTITEIAAECGFNSLRAFNIEFKKAEGITPTEYKQKK